ncbi:hypothetical protein Emed_000934 [Eimeria media]
MAVTRAAKAAQAAAAATAAAGTATAAATAPAAVVDVDDDDESPAADPSSSPPLPAAAAAAAAAAAVAVDSEKQQTSPNKASSARAKAGSRRSSSSSNNSNKSSSNRRGRSSKNNSADSSSNNDPCENSSSSKGDDSGNSNSSGSNSVSTAQNASSSSSNSSSKIESISSSNNINTSSSTSNSSDTNTSSSSSSSSNTNTISTSSSSSSRKLRLPRVSLSLLHQTSKPQQDPSVFKGLSLGPQTLRPHLEPIQEGGPPTENQRPFLDMTAAPGVVTLRPLKPAQDTSNSSSSSSYNSSSSSSGKSKSSGVALVGWNEEGEKRTLNQNKVAAAVAAGGGAPRVTDMLLREGPLGGVCLPFTDKEELRKRERKQRQQEEKKTLSKWFNMPLSEVSPHLLRELRVLQLRGHASSKAFGARSRGPLVPLQTEKRKDGGPPTHAAYLQVARVVGGGLKGVGEGKESQAAGAVNRGPGRRGGASSSLLHSLLNDPEVDRWTKRKYKEIQQKHTNRHSPNFQGKHKKMKKHK